MMLAALMAALSAAAWLAPRTRPQRLAAAGAAFARRDGPGLGAEEPEAGNPALVPLACAVGGIAAWLVIGGSIGIAAGLAVAIGVPIVLTRLEPRAERRHRESIEAAAPLVADLMAACLSSGASTQASTQAAASALDGPAAAVLSRCVAHMELGADPADVWRTLGNEPAFAPIARAIARSADTGAPLADLLLRTGEDLRSQQRARLEALARSAGVRAIGPLGVCFLPAFMVIGVVPLVASMVTKMLG